MGVLRLQRSCPIRDSLMRSTSALLAGFASTILVLTQSGTRLVRALADNHRHFRMRLHLLGAAVSGSL